MMDLLDSTHQTFRSLLIGPTAISGRRSAKISTNPPDVLTPPTRVPSNHLPPKSDAKSPLPLRQTEPLFNELHLHSRTRLYLNVISLRSLRRAFISQTDSSRSRQKLRQVWSSQSSTHTPLLCPLISFRQLSHHVFLAQPTHLINTSPLSTLSVPLCLFCGYISLLMSHIAYLSHAVRSLLQPCRSFPPSFLLLPIFLGLVAPLSLPLSCIYSVA